MLLQPIIASLWGVVTSTQQAVQKIEETVVGPDDIIFTIDIKEFFMTGSPDQLLSSSVQCLFLAASPQG